MKLGKPVYDSSVKVYTCKIMNGVRFVVRREEGKYVNDLSSFVDNDSITQYLLTATAGWFTKPLTADYLQPKLKAEFPTELDPAFEGEVEWGLEGLTISKDIFLLTYQIISSKQDEKICIKFEEETQAQEDIPLDEKEVIGIGPTRQQITKQKVLKARARAARALFLAERLTQEYYNEFGETTDWEDESLSE